MWCSPKMGRIHLVPASPPPPNPTQPRHTAETLKWFEVRSHQGKTSPPHWLLIILWPGVVLELEEVMEAVDAVVGSWTFTATFVALWITGAWNSKVEWFHGILPSGGSFQKEGGTLERCDCGYPRVCEDLSPTIVLLCELLVSVCHYFCRARLFTSKDVRVHGGAIQDQRPLLQFACSNKSSVNVSKIDSASCYRSDTLVYLTQTKW